jgi:prolyl-tRNA synthetase
VKQASDDLYQDCLDRGIEVLLDDRHVRPGVMFSDMELIGISHRIVLSERGLGSKIAEYKGRRDESAQEVALAELPRFLENLITQT